jgi:ABC-2 type transport system permease protein
VWAIVVKEFRELRRDRRTVALLFMLPVLFLVVFGYAASFDVKHVPTVVVGPLAVPVAAHLPGQLDVLAVRPGEGLVQAREALRDGTATVAIVTPSSPTSGNARILIDGTELFAARAAVTAFVELRAAGGASQPPAETVPAGTATAPTGTPVSATTAGGLRLPTPQVLFNPQLKTSVIMIPGLCGIILVFVGTVATALGVVRERQAGTLEQLAVMPFRAWQVFVGKIAPYLVIAAIDMVVIVLVGMALFGVPFRGSVLTFALGAALFLFVTLGIGVLISTISQTQGQAIQLAMMTLLPQILLSGLFFPIYAMAAGVRWIPYVLPLTYFVKIARGVMVRGEPASALWFPLLMLAVLGLVTFGLSVLRFRRDLAPAGRAARAGANGGAPGAPPAAPIAADPAATTAARTAAT